MSSRKPSLEENKGGAERREFMSWTNFPKRKALRDVPTLDSKSLRRAAMADEEGEGEDEDEDERRWEARRILAV